MLPSLIAEAVHIVQVLSFWTVVLEMATGIYIGQLRNLELQCVPGVELAYLPYRPVIQSLRFAMQIWIGPQRGRTAQNPYPPS